MVVVAAARMREQDEIEKVREIMFDRDSISQKLNTSMLEKRNT